MQDAPSDCHRPQKPQNQERLYGASLLSLRPPKRTQHTQCCTRPWLILLGTAMSIQVLSCVFVFVCACVCVCVCVFNVHVCRYPTWWCVSLSLCVCVCVCVEQCVQR